VLIADRLTVPDGTDALLWDMDGVLLDTLTMDYELVNRLLSSRTAAAGEVPRQIIREYFPYDIPDFWRLLLDKIGLVLPQETVDELVSEHEKAREFSQVTIHDGIADILTDSRSRGLVSAVVSNNPEADIDRMLVTAGLRNYFSTVVGNDDQRILKKPAPDSYLEAARRLAAVTSCVALEDSLLGAQAAKTAGCWTIGVATGATDFSRLSISSYVDRCYASFAPCRIALGREGETQKSLVTPNEFVSHMIEHVAGRLGCSINVFWTNDDWFQLGRELGHRVAELCGVQDSTYARGMVDDGSCELALRRDGKGGVCLRAAAGVDLDWLLALPLEQLPNGQTLASLLKGLGAGCGVSFDIMVASAEDPRHTWEEIFRGVGMGLNQFAGARE
jgi:HAD superfamily hydrolase (TIGR01509 family)